MAASRSSIGCWTCRLRKKKCDRVDPVCGPCEFRNITCHGYGPKPDILTSAEDQKLEIAKIQRAVSDSFKARRAFRVAKKSSRPSSLRNVLPANRSVGTAEVTAASDEQLQFKPDTAVSSIYGNAIQLTTPEPSTGSGSNSTPELQHTDLVSSELYPQIFLQDAYPAQNSRDFILVKRYLDQIFPRQFYFYQPTERERGREWLLTLILRSKSSHYVALAFSVLQEIRFVHNDSLDIDHKLYEDLDEYHTLSLSALQEHLEFLSAISGHEHLSVGIDILTSTIQLCSFEVFRQSKLYRGWKGDWEIHLNAAGSLLSIIAADLDKSSEYSSAPLTDEIRSASPYNPGDSPSYVSMNDYAGLDLFTTTYVWADIIRCACMGVKQPNQYLFSYLKYLEEGRVRLDKLMGVQNWAMISIRHISNLESWKVNLQGSLDVSMMYQRVSDIEIRLKQGLETLSRTNTHDLGPYDKKSLLVTELYALAALIYLVIVSSGDNPYQPEVRLSAHKILEKLKILPPHLLMRVSWPFCIAGCMAVESERDAVRNILSESIAGGNPPGTLLNGLELMEESWRMRDDLDDLFGHKCPSSTPWALAMERQVDFIARLFKFVLHVPLTLR